MQKRQAPVTSGCAGRRYRRLMAADPPRAASTGQTGIPTDSDRHVHVFPAPNPTRGRHAQRVRLPRAGVADTLVGVPCEKDEGR